MAISPELKLMMQEKVEAQEQRQIEAAYSHFAESEAKVASLRRDLAVAKAELKVARLAARLADAEEKEQNASHGWVNVMALSAQRQRAELERQLLQLDAGKVAA